MYFQDPSNLLLLWILPCVAAMLAYAQWRKRAAAQRFVAAPMVPRLMPKLGGLRVWLKGTLMMLGLGLIILAAARPRFGDPLEKTSRRGVDCYILLDVSRSMLANDVAPSRLERAKSDVRDLFGRLAGDQVGLIVFAGAPAVKAPLTTDFGYLRMELDAADAYSVPRGGSHIGGAIRKALEVMPPSANRDQMLILITDGDDQESHAEDAARQAAEQGVSILAVGLGDSEKGSRIPIRDAAGKAAFLTLPDGKEYFSKANQDLLGRIAAATDGVHLAAGTRAYDLGQVYDAYRDKLAHSEESLERARERYHEQFQVPLALGISLLIIELVFPGAATPRLAASRGFSVNRRAAVAAILVLVLPSPSLAAGSREPAGKVKAAVEAFHNGDYEAAIEALDAAERLAPGELRIEFDRGCAFAALGKKDKAEEQFRLAAGSPDPAVAAQAHYNLGCMSSAAALAAFGAHPETALPAVRQEGSGLLQEAIGRYRQCLAADPRHADARHNLETAVLWLQKMQADWKMRDRRQLRDETLMLEFVQVLEKQQRSLRSDNRAILQAADSPKRREAIRLNEIEQRALIAEIDFLVEKIRATFARGKPTAASGRFAFVTRIVEAYGDAREPLLAQWSWQFLPISSRAKLTTRLLFWRRFDGIKALAYQARTAMRTAAKAEKSGRIADAVHAQTEAAEKLNALFLTVVPYQMLVTKVIGMQRTLINENRQAVESLGEKANAKQGLSTRNAQPSYDWEEAAWSQQIVTGYCRGLPAKARIDLALFRLYPTAVPTPPGSEKDDADERRDTFERSLQSGITMAPRAVELTVEAAHLLRSPKPADALPKQEEALELLEVLEFLESAPPIQSPVEEEPATQNESPKGNQKDGLKGKPKNRAGEPDEESPEQRENPEPSEDKLTGANASRARGHVAKQPPRDLTLQQAEAVLRKARDRMKQQHDLEKGLQEQSRRPDSTQQNW